MNATEVYWREAGAGPSVICLHSNASVSGQWKPLIDRISSQFTVLAPDLLGAGRSPQWQHDRKITLADEVDLIEPVIARAGERFALAGHSYGAAVALKAALRMPHRVTCIAVYEPTLFSLIDADSPPPNDADGIRQAAQLAATAIEQGDSSAAAELFIDYWMGPGSWAGMPTPRQPAIADSMANVQHWSHALFKEPAALSDLGQLRMPVLYMTGARSTAAAHGVARRLLPALSNVTPVEFPELGHMGPVTHPDVVNEAIAAFLAGTSV